MNTRHQLAMLGIFVACTQAACTTQIIVNPVSENPGATADGIIYSLPMLALRVQSTYTLKSCISDKVNQAVVEAKVDAEPVYVPDPAQTYSISYQELEKLTKATDLKVVLHPNGMLKSINADLTDNTGPIIAKTIGQVLKLAMTSVGAATMGDPGAPPPSMPVPCNRDIVRQVETANQLDDKISSNTDQVDQFNNKLSDLPANHPDVPKLKAARRALQEAIDKDTKALQKVRKNLSVTQVVTVFPGVTADKSEKDSAFTKQIELPAATVALWFASQTSPDESKLFLDVRGVDGRLPVQHTATTNPDKGYIVYRQSKPVRVTICAIQSCWSDNSLIVPDTQQLLAAVYLMPQAGNLARIGIKNGPLAKNSVTAEFAENGNLGSLAFKTTTEGVEKTQMELDETIATYGKYRAGQQDSATNKLNRLTNQFKAQKELADAQKALIDAQNELEKAKTKSGGSEQ